MRNAIALVVGLGFGLGLCLSGMYQPSKVLGFLDVAGDWDPSLALVMGGAIAVALPAFALARRTVAGPAWGVYKAASVSSIVAKPAQWAG